MENSIKEFADAVAEKLTKCPATAAVLGRHPEEVQENLKRSWSAIIEKELGLPSAQDLDQVEEEKKTAEATAGSSSWPGITAGIRGGKKKNGNGAK